MQSMDKTVIGGRYQHAVISVDGTTITVSPYAGLSDRMQAETMVLRAATLGMNTPEIHALVLTGDVLTVLEIYKNGRKSNSSDLLTASEIIEAEHFKAYCTERARLRCLRNLLDS
jgi:hypothetical protein